MMDAPTAEVLLNLLARESRSLLHYLSEVLPWPMPEDPATLARLERITTEEQRQVTALGRFLVRQRIIPPTLPPFPDFTWINFVALELVLPVLIEEERKAIAQLERDVAAVTDPPALALVNQLLETKRQHLQALEALAAVQAEKAGAQPAAAAT